MQDKPESKYRDESAEVVKGSDYAEGRHSGETDGEGTESSSPKFTPAKGEQKWRDAPPAGSDVANH